jgi:hypothetical protein
MIMTTLEGIPGPDPRVDAALGGEADRRASKIVGGHMPG